MRLKKSLAIYVVQTALILLNSSHMEAVAAANTSPSPMMTMPIVAPLFIDDGNFTSTLVLVNGSALSTYADITVRSREGKTVANRRVQFNPHSQRQVSIRQLLDSSKASDISSGSVLVQQSPELNGMVISAALSMTRLSSPDNYIDQELAMPSEEGSSSLRAVADESSGLLLLAVTSTSEGSQHVNIKCLFASGPEVTKSIDLSPGETLITDACYKRTLNGAELSIDSDDDGHGHRGPIGIELTSNSTPGSYSAFGLASHESRNRRYFTSVPFVDPKMVMSTTTIFAGIPVGRSTQLPEGNYTPTVYLTNFSKGPRRVNIRFAHTSEDEIDVREVETVLLSPQSSQELSLPHLKGESNLQNTLLVEADGEPADVVSKFVARGDSGLRAVELLGKDLKDPMNGGNHPWSIEDGSDSTLLLFNASDSSQYFNVVIAAGAVMWQKAYHLKQMQTVAVGIRELISREVKDDSGRNSAQGDLERADTVACSESECRKGPATSDQS
jgi:hypothetical protein